MSRDLDDAYDAEEVQHLRARLAEVEEERNNAIMWSSKHIDRAMNAERERDEVNKKLDQILTDESYEGGVQYWIAKHDAVLLREAKLRAENTALRVALEEINDTERCCHYDRAVAIARAALAK